MKNILITGISSELGSFLASNLAVRQDIKILGTMRRKVLATETFPENIEILENCDLLIRDHCKAAGAAVRRLFDDEFGVIHSVGDFWDHVPFLEFSSDDSRRMIASHVDTFHNTMQFSIPEMKRVGGGSVVAFSCNSVRFNYPWMASFTAAKSAIDSLVRSLANEFSGDHIRFNSLQLSSLKTKKVHDSKPHGDFKNFIDLEDLLPIVDFLLSDSSKLVNGSCLNVFQHSETYFQTGYFERVSK